MLVFQIYKWGLHHGHHDILKGECNMAACPHCILLKTPSIFCNVPNQHHRLSGTLKSSRSMTFSRKVEPALTWKKISEKGYTVGEHSYCYLYHSQWPDKLRPFSPGTTSHTGLSPQAGNSFRHNTTKGKTTNVHHPPGPQIFFGVSSRQHANNGSIISKYFTVSNQIEWKIVRLTLNYIASMNINPTLALTTTP